MSFRSWRSPALFVLAFVAFSVVDSTARAGHVSLTIPYDYSVVNSPGFRDDPFYLPIYVDASFDPGWSFYRFDVLQPVGLYGSGGELPTLVFDYPPEPPLPKPLFDVVVLPGAYGLLGGSVYLSGINDATGDIETVRAYYLVNVTSPYATPEPSSMALLGLGALGVAGRFMRRRA